MLATPSYLLQKKKPTTTFTGSRPTSSVAKQPTTPTPQTKKFQYLTQNGTKPLN